MPDSIRTISFLLLAVALAGAAVAAQTPDEEPAASRAYLSANGLLNRGLYELAATEYRQFLERYPDHAKCALARYGLGVSLFRLGDYDEAVPELTRVPAIESFPYAVEVAVVLGQSHLARRDLTSAIAVLDEADIDPQHPLADDAAVLLVEALHDAGEYDRVAIVAHAIETQWPESPVRDRAELFRSLAEIGRGQHGPAAKRLQALLARDPGGPHAEQAQLLLAQSLHRTRALPAALERYRQVIERGREAFVPDAMYGLAILLHEQREADRAATLLDDLLARFPEHETATAARLLRGRIFFEGDDYERAIPLFTRVAKAGGRGTDEAIYWRAKCELRTNEPAAAARRLRAALDRFPDSALAGEMTYDLAVALLQLAERDGAVALLAGMPDRFGGHPLAAPALHLAAVVRHRGDKYDESRTLCDAFLARYPEHDLAGTVTFLRAENMFLAEAYADASAGFQTYLEKFPREREATSARFRLGMAFYHLDQLDRAERTLTEFAGTDAPPPAFRPALLALGDIAFRRRAWPEAERLLARYLDGGADARSADDALLKLGLARHRQASLEPALAAYDRLLATCAESPHREQARFERGQVLMALERRAEAAEVFRPIAAGDGRLAVHAANHLGALALADDRPADAAAHFARVADRAGDDALAASAFEQRGRALMAADDLPDAIEAFSLLFERFPDSPHIPAARARQAIALARTGQKAAALAAIVAVERECGAALDDELRAALAYEKAWSLRGLDRDDEAKGAYRALLAGDAPLDLAAHARLELAELEMAAREHDTAATLLKTLLETKGDTPALGRLRTEARYRLGVCEYERERYAAAAGQLAAFIDAAPEGALRTSARLLCGEALYRSGKPRAAAKRLERLVAIDPPDDVRGPALLRLGQCLAETQEWARSQKALSEYLAQYGDTELAFQARFGVGWAQEHRERYEEAIASYRAVVDRHDGPTAARAQFQIGQCRFAQEQYQDAVRELLKVDILWAYPEWSAAALYEAGRCFQALRQPAEARAQFEKVRREHPELRWGELAAARLSEIEERGSARPWVEAGRQR